MTAASDKRKNVSPTSRLSKKRKTAHVSLDSLSWRPVVRAHTAGIELDDGLLDLEEVEGVQVEYEQTANGRVAKFLVNESSRATDASAEAEENEQPLQSGVPPGTKATQTTPKPSNAPTSQHSVITEFDSKNLLPAWHSFALHPQLYAAIYSQNFVNPTPIQSQTIPKALSGRDVIGVAETGSGKTLAYGLPILHELLMGASASPPGTKSRRPLRALVLAPTRELALQVSQHLNACLNYHDIAAISRETPKKGKQKAINKGNEKDRRCIALRHPRILERGVDVLVATPGRLWDVLEGDDKLAEDVKNLRFLVLDEADRMIETGHFAELDNILKLTQRQFQRTVTDPEFHSEPPSTSIPDNRNPSPPMQTFVFSATLSKELQQNLKKRWRHRGFQKSNSSSTLDDLLSRLDFRDAEPEINDLKSRIECLATDKDVYLYYFLLRYPGRTLVFMSSIDGIRRLAPLLELLGLPTFPLHSQLEQRQRLKNLDRFKSHAHSILLATDIAARGLDIPLVSHVVHYQIPRTVDTYIHRNGRTARAQRSGFSLLVCAPDERRVVRALFGSLGRQATDVPEMNIEHHFLDKLKGRIRVAKEIDTLQHRDNKAKHEKKWMRATAEAMDIELDSDYQSDDDRAAGSKRLIKAHEAKLGQLKAELRGLLKQPLVARGVSTRYVTSGSNPIAHDMLSGEYHEGMIGVRKAEAGADIGTEKGTKEKLGVFEEWTGIS
ncbi:P-loop containing nucleoside triphosphate hydrolase protein [Russula aff. rugulosa BPL654]|nr:P-loop containing nucleoside triphosphate hydrolase protein [Russula aff. rugulosa BPL654]